MSDLGAIWYYCVAFRGIIPSELIKCTSVGLKPTTFVWVWFCLSLCERAVSLLYLLCPSTTLCILNCEIYASLPLMISRLPGET